VRLGWRIREVPVEYQARTRGQSHFNSLRPALAALGEIVRYWWARRRSG
jgi:hypothetical protein